MAVVKSNGEPGDITLCAMAEGIPAAEVVIEAEASQG
jgi:hypothetical protein